jgi:hypothetical protein
MTDEVQQTTIPDSDLPQPLAEQVSLLSEAKNKQELSRVFSQFPSLQRFDLTEVADNLDSMIDQFGEGIVAEVLGVILTFDRMYSTDVFFNLTKDNSTNLGRFTVISMQHLIQKVLPDSDLFSNVVYELHPDLKPDEKSDTEQDAIDSSLTESWRRARRGQFSQEEPKTAYDYLLESSQEDIENPTEFSDFSIGILKAIQENTRPLRFAFGRSDISFDVAVLSDLVAELAVIENDANKRQLLELLVGNSCDLGLCKKYVSAIQQLSAEQTESVLENDDLLSRRIGLGILKNFIRDSVDSDDVVKTSTEKVTQFTETMSKCRDTISNIEGLTVDEFLDQLEVSNIKILNPQELIDVFEGQSLSKDSLPFFMFVADVFSQSFLKPLGETTTKSRFGFSNNNKQFDSTFIDFAQEVKRMSINWEDISQKVDTATVSDLYQQITLLCHSFSFISSTEDGSLILKESLLHICSEGAYNTNFSLEKVQELSDFAKELASDDGVVFKQITSMRFRDISKFDLLNPSLDGATFSSASTSESMQMAVMNMEILKKMFENEQDRELIIHFVKQSTELAGSVAYFNFKIAEWPYVIRTLSTKEKIDDYLHKCLQTKRDGGDRLSVYDFANTFDKQTVENYELLQTHPSECAVISKILAEILSETETVETTFHDDQKLLTHFIIDRYRGDNGYNLSVVFSSLLTEEARNVFVKILDPKPDYRLQDLAGYARRAEIFAGFLEKNTMDMSESELFIGLITESMALDNAEFKSLIEQLSDNHTWDAKTDIHDKLALFKKAVETSILIQNFNLGGFFIHLGEQKINLDSLGIYVDVLQELSVSAVPELQKLKKEIGIQLCRTSEPKKMYESILNIFVRNNLPTMGKIFLVFQLLYPEQRFADLIAHYSSPYLQRVVDGWKETESVDSRRSELAYKVIYSDLIRSSMRSGNESLIDFVSMIGGSTELLSKAEDDIEVAWQENGDEIKKVLNQLLTLSGASYVENASLLDKGLSVNSLESAKTALIHLRSVFQIPETQTFSQWFEQTYLVPLSISNYEEFLSYAESIKKSCSDRNADQVYIKDGSEYILVNDGDLLKGFSLQYLDSLAVNGFNCPELLGSNSGSDRTPIDVDAAEIRRTLSDENELKMSEAIERSVASKYGNVIALFRTKPPTGQVDAAQYDRFQFTSNDAKATYDPNKYELFRTGVLGEEHMGIRSSIGWYDVDALILNGNPDEMKMQLDKLAFTIASRGVYIPVTNLEGKVLFTHAEFTTYANKFKEIEDINIKDVLESETTNVLEHLEKFTFISELLEADAGVSEGYSIGVHTNMVLGNFERFFADKQDLVEPFTSQEFRLFLVLHDIGKSLSVNLEGSTAMQHKYTEVIAKKILRNAGVRTKSVDLMLSIMSKDLTGEYLQGKRSLEETSRLIISEAEHSGVSAANYATLSEVYFMCDAGAYTEFAGGIASLDSLFQVDTPNNTLALNDSNRDKMTALKAALQDK